jgi:hypothetical protein
MSEEAPLLDRSFDKMDESDLALILGQVARRILQLRQTSPDISFWFTITLRLSKWLNNLPRLNDVEKRFIIGPNQVGVNGRVRAIVTLRQRSGMRLQAAKAVVDKWISDNLPNRSEDVSI